jgi:hypothetical protein
VPNDSDDHAARFDAERSSEVEAVETPAVVRAAAAAGVMIVLGFRPGDCIDALDKSVLRDMERSHDPASVKPCLDEARQRLAVMRGRCHGRRS